MARDAFKDTADKTGLGRNSDAWANNMPRYKDPATGKTVNSIGDWRPESQVRQRPVDPGKTGPGDSRA